MFIRKKNKQKFFEPDKNHIHHKLLKAGFSHVKSSILILFVYSTSIVFCLLTSELNITLHFVLSLTYSLTSIFFLMKVFVKKER